MIERFFGKEAARHAGLVGEQEHEIAGLVQPRYRLGGVRHPADAIPGAHIAVVMIDDGVAVQESGGRLQRRVIHVPLIMARSMDSQMPCATARWICWITGVSSLGAT